MVVKIILNGGIKSCCSVTPTEVVENAVREWIGTNDELMVIDITRDAWEPEPLASLARRHFQDEIFPLLYLDGKLTRVGGLPGRSTLLAMMEGSIEYGIDEKDILLAAERRQEELVEAGTEAEQ